MHRALNAHAHSLISVLSVWRNHGGFKLVPRFDRHRLVTARGVRQEVGTELANLAFRITSMTSSMPCTGYEHPIDHLLIGMKLCTMRRSPGVFFGTNFVCAPYCDAILYRIPAPSMSGKAFTANYLSAYVYRFIFAFTGFASGIRSIECSITSVASMSLTDRAKQSLYKGDVWLVACDAPYLLPLRSTAPLTRTTGRSLPTVPRSTPFESVVCQWGSGLVRSYGKARPSPPRVHDPSHIRPPIPRPPQGAITNRFPQHFRPVG